MTLLRLTAAVLFAYGIAAAADRVDASTLNGKVLLGYQGWFSCPGDGSALNRWWHYCPSGQTPSGSNIQIDFWPDLSEFSANEQFNTGNFTFPGGGQAPLFTGYLQATVVHHFQWMSDYNLDGAMLQRFTIELTGGSAQAFRDQVTRNVRAAAE